MSNLSLAGYHLTFDDEFSDPASFLVSPNGTPGTFKTQYDWGGRTVPSNKEAEYYEDPSYGINPFSVQNGELTITAQPAPAGADTDGMPYTSGMITTQNLFSQHGGYFEVRAQVTGGSGLWPAFWMLPTTGADYPEIDVMEDPNLGNGNQYWIHSTGPDNGGGGYVQTDTQIAGGYHTYGVMWNDNTTTFYFDGQPVGEYATPSAMASLAMYMIINLAVGGDGSWPGSAPASSLPAQYNIDYIRAYSNDPSIPAVPLQPISSPDGVNTTPVLTLQPIPTTTIGTGPDVLTLNMSEDQYYGDAQFTVSIDGVQQGGTLTVTATHGQQSQAFAIDGNFGTSNHTVSISFLNDSYGGTPYLDRNLYLDSAAIDGIAVAGATFEEQNNGSNGFSFTAAAPTSYPTITLGSGPDTLALAISEDAWQGNAQFTILVDGTQIGGLQTASAPHSSGAMQTFDVLGTFSGGPHDVTVDFMNNAYGGTSTTDRNLYVDGATIDGQALSGSTLAEYSGGPQSFSFTTPATPGQSGDGAQTVTLGSGSDMVSVGISGDAWDGQPQFTLAVDGTQIGGVQTALASHSTGQSQTFDLLGDFGSGPHAVTVDFLNDAYGGTSSEDRNLYVDSLSYNGIESPTDTAALMSSGPVSLGIPGVSPTPDTITFYLTEDAYDGNAQARLSLDGQVLGTPTITFLNSAATPEAFTYTGEFGPGPHTASVSFLNDAYGGSPSLDRNLYVKSIEYDGTNYPGFATELQVQGTDTFTIPLHTS